jgi:hypothetical protein
MRFQNGKKDLQSILSWFSESFSRPSFKLFSSFIVSFIQLGKENHTSSMVQSLTSPFLHRSLPSFTRFLGQNCWAVQEVAETVVEQFFRVLGLTAQSVLFFIIDDTLIHKTGTHIPGCGWHKDHAQNMANVFGHQWVLSVLLYKEFLLPLWARLYHPKGTKGCGYFQTKIALAKRMVKDLLLPLPCKLYVLADSWYWAKALVKVCRTGGYHMISQLKSNSVLWVHGKKTKVTSLLSLNSSYREVSLFIYGKTKKLSIARFVGEIKEVGEVAVVVVREKHKKPIYLVCTNLHLPAISVIQYYARRWKIEQMIKDLKQRLGLGDYQVRNLRAIQRHVALVLLSYFALTFLKVLQWLRDKKTIPDLSIRLLAFYVRKHILVETITVILKTMKIQFKQNVLDTYLDPFYPLESVRV